MKDYQQLDASVAHSAEMLEQALPAVLQPFQDMAKSAKGEGAIPHQSRLLIALGIAISTHCDPCIARHARKLAECGASRQEIAEVAGICISMSGGISLTYANSALEAFDYFSLRITTGQGAGNE